MTSTKAPPPLFKRRRPTRLARNLLMILVGFVTFASISAIVLYGPIVYGDMVENYGIVMMMTVPIIAAVTFRVALDAWVDKR